MSGADAEVATFVADLVQELQDNRMTLCDTEFLAAVEAGTATRSQIAAWAKTFHSTTRNGRIGLGNYYANSPEDSELRADLAANIYEEDRSYLGRQPLSRRCLLRLPLRMWCQPRGGRHHAVTGRAAVPTTGPPHRA
jgi:hypothetical protein